MKIQAKSFAYRRWIRGALAINKPLALRAKITLALVIFFFAYLVRSLHAVDLAPVMYTSDQPFNNLTETFDQRALSITQGEGLLGPYNIDPADTKWIMQAPGYAIFLSAIYKLLGRDFFTVQLVQNALNSLSPVLIFLIAGRLLGWRVGVTAGVLAAASHHMAHISNFILPDSLTALPILVGVYFLIIARRSRHQYRLYAAAGLMIGIASWLRAQPMLLGLFFMVILALFFGRRLLALKRGAVMAAVSLLVIAPITIRNYAVYGEFVPIQTGTGINLWEGIGEASGDRFGAVRLDTEVAQQEAELYNDPRYAGSHSTPDGIKRDRDRIKRSLDIILSHPFWYAGVMLARCGEMLKYSAHAPLVFKPQGDDKDQQVAPIKRSWNDIRSDGSSLRFAESLFWLRPVVRTVQRTAKETMLLFIIIGAAALFRASWRRGLLISLVPLYFFIFQSFLHTEFRYTLPMQYFVFVFAAVSWVLIIVLISNGARALLKKRRAQTAAD